MANRTIQKYIRAYIDGYDMSGYARTVGEMVWEYGEAMDTALTDEVVGGYPGLADIRTGSLNTLFDNSTDSAHDALSTSDVVRDCMYPIGMGAAPASGDPVFCAPIVQTGYQKEDNDVNSLATANLNFGGWDRRADILTYDIPWGYLLHAKGAETAVNSGTSDHDYGAQTTAGGYMMYQVFSSDGTVAIKVQDAATDADVNYSDLISSGNVDASASPVSGLTALAVGATVEQFTRWQITLGTATTVTFALAFIRGR